MIVGQFLSFINKIDIFCHEPCYHQAYRERLRLHTWLADIAIDRGQNHWRCAQRSLAGIERGLARFSS